MTPQTADEALKLAEDDRDSVIALTQDLVRLPSRGGIDSYDPVLERMENWLHGHGLPAHRLTDTDGQNVALVSEVVGDPVGPRYVLDACLDTAPFGDEKAWSRPPTSGDLVDGWMHGRGTSDSKVGAAVFAHLAARLNAVAGGLGGSLVLLFDVDEHTGGFGGAKAYFEGSDAPPRVDGVMIGYPGIDHVVIGGRGVLRAQMHVYGVAAHSGSRSSSPNAITKAAQLVSALHAVELPDTAGETFPLPAKLTVTAITGGQGYSTVPDLCILNVDIRLTPALAQQDAVDLLHAQAAAVDAAWPETKSTSIDFTTRWPEYALPDSSPLRAALLDGAHAVRLAPTAKIAGPSNIGNYLAGLGVPATAGFGVDHIGLHATDERIRLDTIEPVQAAYQLALNVLFAADQHERGC
ncbi:M20 family metallopeptidase [Actinomadura sp. BRA 177]|uniref:M20 family metallopeptidase n=1 Tax=Actinomadura sp. BRA 177 TaxID=2745202 RepID=UPI0015957161|nr:M20/M25/M40 family metallo-hydrolase [Actinomadura sp. BRA 177]NVI87658.1 M20/M25/M40 family metallo-hydrolase [Actinomadura sp. BRA 177]